MKMKTHSVYIRMMSLLLAVLCIVGLFPASALAASPNTIKLEDCTYNGVHYDSPALGICYMHQMQFDFNGDSVMGFCSEKGKGMGWSLDCLLYTSRTASLNKLTEQEKQRSLRSKV